LDYYIKENDKYIVKDELTSICPIKNIKMTDNMQEKDIKYYTEYFFVSTKTNIKLFKYKEGKIIFISDFEFENYDIINEEIHLQNIRQLDNGMITIHLNNNTHFNICLSPKFIVFFRNIILNLIEVFNYLESIIIKDKEKNILVKAFNENWEDLEPETDYTLHGKKQILEKNNWENPNTDIDIDKNEIDSDDKILLKIIDQYFLFKIHKSEYTLEFTPKGVNVKKGNKIFDNLTISDGTYQEGKVIEIENDETKNIVSVILIKNTDTQSSINLYFLDLINNKIDLIDEFKIPRIKDYSFYMVDKNEKKELIILLSCEFNILLFLYKLNISYKSNNVDYDLKFGSRIKTQKTFPKI
jgi:hypothetical protein